MGPNTRGSCTVCLTLNWECTCDPNAEDELLNQLSALPPAPPNEVANPQLAQLQNPQPEAPVVRPVLGGPRKGLTSVGQSADTREAVLPVKRRAEAMTAAGPDSEQSDGSAESDYKDLLQMAQDNCEKYGVQFQHYQGRHVRHGIMWAIQLCQSENVQSWYVGASKDPAERFYEFDNAHRFRFQVMYVLALGTNIGHFEKRAIQKCTETFPSGRQNVGNGGEHIHKDSVKFLYICLK